MINNAFNRLNLTLRSPERAKKHVRRKLANGLNSREIARINAAKAAQNLNKKRKVTDTVTKEIPRSKEQVEGAAKEAKPWEQNAEEEEPVDDRWDVCENCQ